MTYNIIAAAAAPIPTPACDLQCHTEVAAHACADGCGRESTHLVPRMGAEGDLIALCWDCYLAGDYNHDHRSWPAPPDVYTGFADWGRDW